jgi:hypothetical protein
MLGWAWTKLSDDQFVLQKPDEFIQILKNASQYQDRHRLLQIIVVANNNGIGRDGHFRSDC